MIKENKQTTPVLADAANHGNSEIGKKTAAPNVLKPISLNVQNKQKQKRPPLKPKPKVTNQMSPVGAVPAATSTTTTASITTKTTKKPELKPILKETKPKNVTPLYVGDLDKKVDDALLSETFSKYGTVVSVKICPSADDTGKALGYGYVNFQNEEDAMKAMEKLNYTKLLGSEIRIMPSFRDQHKKNNSLGTNVFFSNLPKGLTTREFYDAFKSFGNILSCKINYDKLQGFILFKNTDEAIKVVSKFNNSDFKGSKLYVGVHTAKDEREKQRAASIVSNTSDREKLVVYVKNLPLDISEVLLQNKFQNFGPISSIFINPVTKLDACWALVTFQIQRDANKAIAELNGSYIGDKQISCTRAKKRASTVKSNDLNTNVVCFKDLPADLSQDSLSEFCSKFGTVKSIIVETKPNDNGKTSTTAFVELKENLQAAKVVSNVGKSVIGNNHKVNASLWKPAWQENNNNNDQNNNNDNSNYNKSKQGEVTTTLSTSASLKNKFVGQKSDSLLSKVKPWHIRNSRGQGKLSNFVETGKAIYDGLKYSGASPFLKDNLTFRNKPPIMIPISPTPQQFPSAAYPFSSSLSVPHVVIPSLGQLSKSEAFGYLGEKQQQQQQKQHQHQHQHQQQHQQKQQQQQQYLPFQKALANRTISDLKNLVQHIIKEVHPQQNISIETIELITSYILVYFWDNDIAALRKFLNGYDVDQSHNVVLKQQVAKTVRMFDPAEY